MATKGLNRHKRRLGSKDPRVTSSQTFTSTNHRGEHKPMHKSNGKNTRSAQVLHSQIPPKATNAYGGRREKEQENHTRTPRLRSIRFTSLRRGMDWWNCRSRSPLTFMQESWEGLRGRQVFPRSTMEEREGKNVLKWLGNHWGRMPLK